MHKTPPAGEDYVSGDDKNQYTPMMRQYLEIKEEYAINTCFSVSAIFTKCFSTTLSSLPRSEIVLTSRDAGAPAGADVRRPAPQR